MKEQKFIFDTFFTHLSKITGFKEAYDLDLVRRFAHVPLDLLLEPAFFEPFLQLLDFIAAHLLFEMDLALDFDLDAERERDFDARFVLRDFEPERDLDFDTRFVLRDLEPERDLDFDTRFAVRDLDLERFFAAGSQKPTKASGISSPPIPEANLLYLQRPPAPTHDASSP
jgi:hypothetical protein